MLTSDLRKPSPEIKEIDTPSPSQPPASLDRRDILTQVTGAVGLVGVCGLAWPFLQSLKPTADVAALAAVDVDISTIPEGQGLIFLWCGIPVFIRHCTKDESNHHSFEHLDAPAGRQ